MQHRHTGSQLQGHNEAEQGHQGPFVAPGLQCPRLGPRLCVSSALGAGVNQRVAWVGGDVKDHLIPTRCHRQGCHPNRQPKLPPADPKGRAAGVVLVGPQAAARMLQPPCHSSGGSRSGSWGLWGHVSYKGRKSKRRPGKKGTHLVLDIFILWQPRSRTESLPIVPCSHDWRFCRVPA